MSCVFKLFSGKLLLVEKGIVPFWEVMFDINKVGFVVVDKPTL
jgi:hypothetical protein